MKLVVLVFYGSNMGITGGIWRILIVGNFIQNEFKVILPIKITIFTSNTLLKCNYF